MFKFYIGLTYLQFIEVLGGLMQDTANKKIQALTKIKLNA